MALFENTDDTLTAPAIRNGDFAQALTGWTTEALGDRGGVPGRVNVAGGMAHLVENESFLVSLNQTFTIPPAPETLSFDLISLFLENPQGGVPDAFEVSLLDSIGNSLVATFRAEATSFFNVNPSVGASLAPGVTFDSTRVTLDISALSPGTPATVFFDLIGNGRGAGSSAVIDNVRVAPEAIHVDAPARVSLLPAVSGTAAVSHCDAEGDGDLDLLLNESRRSQSHTGQTTAAWRPLCARAPSTRRSCSRRHLGSMESECMVEC